MFSWRCSIFRSLMHLMNIVDERRPVVESVAVARQTTGSRNSGPRSPRGYRRLLFIAALFSLFGQAHSQAEEALSQAGHDAALEDGHEAGVHHRHHAALFVGGSTKYEHGQSESGLAIGVDYEYRFHPNWSVGGIVEGVATQGVRDVAAAAMLSWHPVGGLKLTAGPGIEANQHHELFMFRAGVSYGFEIGPLTLAPEVAVDITNQSHVLVYGFSLGTGF